MSHESATSESPIGARILVVEDEQDVADALVLGLREEGLDVEHAADGRRAGDALRAGPWDLVLLDRWLPGEDGLAVLRRYRGEGGAAPVIFLTARDSVADRIEGLDGGADDYLCKPFAFDELLARIRARLRRRDPVHGPSLAYGDVRIDLAAAKAARAGRPLGLTSKELALLVLLVRHPGRLLTRSEIYEGVWDESFTGLSNTLEVHVKELRRKLEACGPRIIHTVRGRGYVLDTRAPASGP